MKEIARINYQDYDMQRIHITSIYNVLNADEIDTIRNRYSERGDCAYNAAKVCTLFRDMHINYCEGLANGIRHCWCELDGVYFDPTAELNGFDINQQEYLLLRKYNALNISLLFAHLGETLPYTVLPYINLQRRKDTFYKLDDNVLYKLDDNDWKAVDLNTRTNCVAQNYIDYSVFMRHQTNRQ